MSAPVETPTVVAAVDEPKTIDPTPAPVDVVKTEEVKPVETSTGVVDTPVVDATKTDEPATETAVTDAAATTDAKDDATKEPEPKKSPGFVARLLAPFKGDKKVKVPKSPKKEKKKEESEATTEAATDAPAVAEPSTEIVTAEPVKVEEVPVVEPVKETETTEPTPVVATEEPVVSTEETSKTEEKKEKVKAAKVGRRLSARVGDLFRPKKESTSVPAKVDESAPQIEEPAPVDPITDVTADAKKDETAKPAEPAPTPAPVVAAAA